MSRIASGLKTVAALVAVALFVVPAVAEPPKPENLDTAMNQAAPKILKDLHKYQNVGVLKFLVAESDGKLRDNVGPLNRTLADRLEVALTLALDDPKLGIIVGASDAVATNPRANHLTVRGRKELFKTGVMSDPPLFRVPWKANEKILPDAFLTGEARISKDRRTIAVKVLLIDKDMAEAGKDPIVASEFTAANDTRTLIETGVTFATERGGDFTKALAKLDKTAPAGDDNGDELKKKASEALSLLNTSPVKLEILYDGVAQEPMADAGDKYNTNVLVRVPSPTEKVKKVSFRLTNLTDDTYGVVLRVNGRNTIYEQRQDPVACYKWILDKKDQSVTVKGFQINESETLPFKVESPEKSEVAAVSYGDNAGTFDLILFRGQPKPAEATVETKPEKQEQVAILTAIARGTMVLRNQPPATDLKSFKAQLKLEGTATTKAGREGGLVVKGVEAEKNPVKQVEFYPSPVPERSITVRYYSLNK